MQIRIYSVHDKKTNVFNQPFFQPNDIFATRFIISTAVDQRSPLSLFSDDFELVTVGIYDDANGKITPHDPQLVLSSLQIREEIANVNKSRL